MYLDISLWIAFLLLALFYFAVDVLNIDKSEEMSYEELMEEFSAHKPGVLDHYVLDSTPSYGLFVSLNEKPVFVDIREDKLIEERKKFAHFLSENSSELERNLNDFVRAHPEFSSKQIPYIGLHSKKLDQGEVFWHPEGYTILEGLRFTKD